MPAIETSSDLIRAGVRATVYIRSDFGEEWEERPYLWLDWCEWAASPKRAAAQLTWHYGTGARQAELAVSAVNRLPAIGWWVKLSIPQTTPSDPEGAEDPADPLLWYGRITRIPDARVARPTNTQTLICGGMDLLLDVEIRQSFFDDGGAGKRRVFEGLEHNPLDRGKADMTHRPQSVGNMSDAAGPDGVRLFAGPGVADLATAKPWTTLKICEYLLEYHAPPNASDLTPCRFELDQPAANLYLPDWDCPRVPTHGRTLRQVLDGLLDRRRGLGYVVEFEEGDDPFLLRDKLVIRPFNYADALIDLGDGHTIEANQDEVSIDFDSALDLKSATVETNAVGRCDQVRAVGQPIVFIGTLKATPDASKTTIVAGWTDAQKTAYNAGASGEAGYGGLTRAEKQQRNRDSRASEELTRVYRYFDAAPEWPEDDDGCDWSSPIPRSFYGHGGMEIDFDAGDRFNYRPALRFLPHLPLRVGYDYSVDLEGPYGLIDTTPAEGSWEYRQPLVIFSLHDDLGSTTGKYQLADRLSTGAGIEGLGDGHGRDFAVGVRVQQAAAGVVLSVHGHPQHAIAVTDFGTGADDTDTSDACPEYDWRDELIVTVAWQTDHPIQKVYPKTEDIDDLIDPIRVRTIDASARAGFHHLLPLTVIGVDAAGDLIYGTEQFVRDDRDLLEQLARIGWEWYGRERRTLTLTWRQAQNAALFNIGDLVTEIGSGATVETIRTVISSIRVTMAQRRGQTHATTVRTQWAEIDVMKVI